MVHQTAQVAAYIGQMCFELHEMALSTGQLGLLAYLLELASLEGANAQLRLLNEESQKSKTRRAKKAA